MITLTHTIRCKPSLSLSFNHHSHSFDDTFERNPILISSPLNSKCCCCCYYYCASISTCNKLDPINPSFLCKKLSLSGNTFRVSSFYELDRSYYYERKKQGKRGFGYNRKKQFLSNVSDECVNDVEVMLSLLTGEVGSEYNDVKNRKKINKEKNNVGSGVGKKDFKYDEVVKIRSLTKRKNLDLRKEGCYGELEGEKGFEVKCDGYVGQTSSSEYKNDFKEDHRSCIDEVVGKIDRGQDFIEEQEELLEKKDPVKGNYGESIGVSQDWRKKTEKKLNEEFSKHESMASVNIETCKQNSHAVDKTTDESSLRMKYKRFTEMSNKDRSIMSSSTTEEKLKGISEMSKPQEINMRGTSSVLERTINNLEEMSKEIDDQIINSSEKKHHFTNSENTSISRRKEFRMEKQKRYSETSSSKEMVTDTAEDVVKVNNTSIEDNKSSSEMILVEEGSGPKGGGSRHSSQGSGPKGPSDEMWHVIDASTQDPSETDAPDNISDTSENGEAVKTSGRSLWTIIGDVVRLNWKSPRSESHTPNSGSETWFSSTKGLDTPLTSSNNNSGPSISTSLAIIKESCGVKKTSEAGETEKSGNDSKIGDLKRRKLVDKDEVSKDKFDEWEDAFNLENKIRKNDQIFMREALLEAKKAADVWEVPVGAVLVKGGKIIARGYNLIEELRDSTAHAEMICIRKASTNLQSWRLSDTTLYVTLEPCPMCAGAILQARIDTVVWGAPNKLLGADGSWIRLFGDGGNDSMLTVKPPAPTHPFHPNMAVRRGVLAAECAEVMQNFFRVRRKMKTEPKPEREPPTPPSSISVSHHHHSNFLSKMHHAFKIFFCL